MAQKKVTSALKHTASKSAPSGALKPPKPASKRPKNTMKVPAEGAFYATGRRKEASARVWIFSGKGNAQVNGRPLDDYFCRDVLKMIVNQPFDVVEKSGKFDIFCTVEGSGTSGQAQAIRHGVANALLKYDETLRSKLRPAGLLTRDSRIVERKKYGKKKARKSFQFSKR